MSIITVADKGTGRIARVVQCHITQINFQARDHEFIVQGGSNDATQYVLNKVITDRPANPTVLDKAKIAVDGEEATISGLPEPCIVSIDDVAYEVPDGVLVFDLDQLGAYKIEVSDCFPYLDKELTIEGIA